MNAFFCYIFVFFAPVNSSVLQRPKFGHQLTYRQKLDSYQDVQYYATISLGGQALKALIDTNSVELVVLSTQCSYWCGVGKNLYRGSDAKNGDLGVELSFNEGQVFGHEAYDQFSIGPFFARQQPFWEITDADLLDLFNADFEAVLGLGPVPKDTRTLMPRDAYNPLAYALALQPSSIWRYSLCLDWRPGFPGYITWNDGVLENNHDKFRKITLIPHQFWFIPLTDVYLGDTLLGCSTGCGAILDSSSSMFSMPPGSYSVFREAIMKLKPSCQSIDSLPDLSFKLDSVLHKIPPDGYIGDFIGSVPTSMNPYFDAGDFNFTNGSTCQPSILNVQLDSYEGLIWILGMPFFRSYYTLFHQDPPSLYTAESTDNCDLDDDDVLRSHRKKRGRARTARLIDFSKLSLPKWLRAAMAAGNLSQLPTNRNVSKLRHNQ